MGRIIQDGKSTRPPTYIGMMDNIQKYKLKQMQFYFYKDNIKRCMKVTYRKWVVSKLEVLHIWHVKKVINLSWKEILAWRLMITDFPKTLKRRLDTKKGIPRSPCSHGLINPCHSSLLR